MNLRRAIEAPKQASQLSILAIFIALTALVLSIGAFRHGS